MKETEAGPLQSVITIVENMTKRITELSGEVERLNRLHDNDAAVFKNMRDKMDLGLIEECKLKEERDDLIRRLEKNTPLLDEKSAREIAERWDKEWKSANTIDYTQYSIWLTEKLMSLGKANSPQISPERAEALVQEWTKDFGTVSVGWSPTEAFRTWLYARLRELSDSMEKPMKPEKAEWEKAQEQWEHLSKFLEGAMEDCRWMNKAVLVGIEEMMSQSLRAAGGEE